MNYSTSAPIVLAAPPPQQGQVTVTFEMVFFGATTIIVSSAIAMGKWLIDREAKRLANRFADLYTQLGILEGRQDGAVQALSDFKLSISQQLVSREDYIRHQTLTEAKMDAVHRRLDQMMTLLMERK
ncbi:hypothetical protein AB3R30_18825 [Leptolyngbyaceae cyanobacterium UHCC 1019]